MSSGAWEPAPSTIEVVQVARRAWTWLRWSQGGELVARADAPLSRRGRAITDAREHNGPNLRVQIVPRTPRFHAG